MESILIIPKNEAELAAIKAFITNHNLSSIAIDEETRKNIARETLSKLSAKNPKAYASMDEIISVVEEARTEIYNAKKDNRS